MKFLERERQTLEKHLPGFDQALTEIPLLDLEKPAAPGIRLFREAGGSKMLIPSIYAGLGATPMEAAQMTRAIASRSPSLAVATTMHNFSVATFVEMCLDSEGAEGLLLEGIARQKLLLASGFAEGKPGQGILSPTMRAIQTPKGFIITGSKKPCSLSHSMDLLTASIEVVSHNGKLNNVAVALIPAKAKGIERRKFWDSWILAGAESDEIILDKVLVEDKLVFPLIEKGKIEPTQISGLLWFELLISASYLGIASALVEKVINYGKGIPSEVALLGIETEGAMAALEGIALSMNVNKKDNDLLGQMLFVRYSVQRAIERSTTLAVELLGGMPFVKSSEVSYLYSAARALAFHPPSRISMCEHLTNFMVGKPVEIV